MQQLAGLAGASQSPSSGEQSLPYCAHPTAHRHLAVHLLTHEVGRLLVAAEEGGHAGTPVGIAVPTHKGSLPVDLHEPSHLQHRRGCAGPESTALNSSMHSTHRARGTCWTPCRVRGLFGAVCVQSNACTIRLVQAELYIKHLSHAMLTAGQSQVTWKWGDLALHVNGSWHAHTALKMCSAASLHSPLCRSLAMLRLGTLPVHRALQVCSSSQ